MLVTAFLLFLTFANLVEGLFYRNLLCNISCLGIYLVLFDVHMLTDSNCHGDTPMEVSAMTAWWLDSPTEGAHGNFIKSYP